MGLATEMRQNAGLIGRIFNEGDSACLAFYYHDHFPIFISTYAIKNILGQTTHQLIEANAGILDWIHPCDIDNYINELADYVNQPDLTHFVKNDFRIINHQDQVEWIREQGYIERNTTTSADKIAVNWHKVTSEYAAKEDKQESLKNIEVMLNTLNVAFFEYYFESQTVVYSDQWKSMLGYSSLEISAQFSEWEKRVPRMHFESIQAAIDDHIQGKTDSFESIYPIRHKQGHLIWCLAKGCMQHNEKGVPYKLAATVTDISAIQNHNQNLDLQAIFQQAPSEPFEQVFNQSPVAMVIHDIEGKVQSINPKMTDLLGYPLSEIKDKNITHFLHDSARQATVINLQLLYSGELKVSTEIRKVKHKCGHYLRVRFSSFIITTNQNDKLLCSSGILLDEHDRPAP